MSGFLPEETVTNYEIARRAIGRPFADVLDGNNQWSGYMLRARIYVPSTSILVPPTAASNFDSYDLVFNDIKYATPVSYDGPI
jgi:hypothetical protein